MIKNYFLLPSDIKVTDKKKLKSSKIRLRYNQDLSFNSIDLCVLDTNNN